MWRYRKLCFRGAPKAFGALAHKRLCCLLSPLRVRTNKAKSRHASARDGFSELQGVSAKRRSFLLRRVHNHLGSGLARFKLRAHLLDLRGLLFELGCEGLYFFLLLRDRSLEIVL